MQRGTKYVNGPADHLFSQPLIHEAQSDDAEIDSIGNQTTNLWNNIRLMPVSCHSELRVVTNYNQSVCDRMLWNTPMSGTYCMYDSCTMYVYVKVNNNNTEMLKWTTRRGISTAPGAWGPSSLALAIKPQLIGSHMTSVQWGRSI
jgi:hypothetical protein